MANPFLTIVCPLVGNILGAIMLLSPSAAVFRIWKTGSLGALNPLPYPFTFLNCFGWVAYGLVLKNPWIPPANILGATAGITFTLIALPHVDRRNRDIITGVMITSAAYFGTLGMIGVFALESSARAQLWGIQCVVVLMCYYIMPLSTLWQIVKKGDASSIYLPLAFAAVANGTMWTLYGAFGTHDPNLWVPNGFGAILAIAQISLRVFYGAKPVGDAEPVAQSEMQPDGMGPDGSGQSEPGVAKSPPSTTELLPRQKTGDSATLVVRDVERGHSPVNGVHP